MDLYKNWACLLSVHGHGSVRPILKGPSGFIFILFSCPLHPFWFVVIEKEDQLGWRLTKYRLTVQCSWVDGWNEWVDGDNVNGLTIENAKVFGVQTSDKLSESINGTWHVSFFDWFLSRIESSLRLPCTFPIKTTPFSSHFSTFRRNTLSESVCHICQRFVCLIPASFVLIRSLFGSVSNFFLFLRFFFIFHSLWKPFIWLLCPVTLSKPVSPRFCHYV